MAAKFPSSVLTENWGALTLYIATFGDIDDADNWESNIEVVDMWCSPTDDPTVASEMIDVARSSSNFIFSTTESNRTCQLYVLGNS